jgi:diketogulonate reductase-like aldo/keto reductase
VSHSTPHKGIGIDTAIGYKDQPAIGVGLKNLGVPRNAVYITSKVSSFVF